MGTRWHAPASLNWRTPWRFFRPSGHRNGAVADTEWKALVALRTAGIRISDENATLERIARDNATTPATLFALIPSQAPAIGEGGSADPLELEARLAGTGIGGKTLDQFAQMQGMPVMQALRNLTAAGIEAVPEDQLKMLAERQATRPIEIAKAMLIPGYRPQKTE